MTEPAIKHESTHIIDANPLIDLVLGCLVTSNWKYKYQKTINERGLFA
jgi:hypothetical protein